MKHTLYIFRLSLSQKVCSYNSATLIKFTYFHVLVEFEVLTEVLVKSLIFWDMTPCSPLKASQHTPRKRRLTFKGLHDFVSQKTEFHIHVCFFHIGQFLCFQDI
jgi:quinol-cytochrome oxidoreductase complex cytochrome b subunit